MSIFDEFLDLNNEEYVENYDLSTCYTVFNGNGEIAVLDVAVAIMQFEGNLSDMARALQKSRRRLETFILNNLSLRELFEDVEEAFLDEIEFKLRNTAKGGDPSAIKFFLSTKGTGRGFTTRSEVGGNDGKPIEVDLNDSRSALAAKLGAILDRRRAGSVPEIADAAGGGEPAVGLEVLGETEPAATGRRDVADVGLAGGEGVRED